MFSRSVQMNSVKEFASYLAGSFFIALCAQISIPLAPVHFTMQTFAILLISQLFGARKGTYVVCLYLLEGALGLPVFANYSCGIGALMSPTGGYLLGFVPAAYFTGRLLECDTRKNFISYFAAGLVGKVLIYICGYLHLAIYVGFSRAWTLGVLPFLFSALGKLTLFSAIACKRR
jgi:biotin transport system substrate-specific component